MTEKQEMLDKISDFFGDTSRSRGETRDGLEEAASLIESYLDTLGEDE